MGKINLLVKYCLINEKFEYNIKGIYKDNKIKYKDTNGIIVLDLNNNILEKYTNDGKIVFAFKKNKCYIDNYNIDINVVKIINKKNMFYVNYKIANDCFEISIEFK